MDIIAAFYIILLLVSFVVMVMMMMYAVKMWHLPGAKYIFYFMLCAIIAQSSFILVHTSPTAGVAFGWARVRFIGFLLAPLTFLLFTFEYTGTKLPRRRLFIPLMLVVPVLSFVLIWSQQVIPIVFTRWSLREFGFLVTEYSKFGWWIYLTIPYIFGVLFWGMYLLISAMLRTRGDERAPLRWTLVGITIIIAMALLPSLMGNILPINATSVGFSIGVIIIGWGMFRHGMFSTETIAQNTVFDSLQDAVIVLSESMVILSVNPSARVFFKKSEPGLIGKTIEQALIEHGYTGKIPHITLSPFEIAFGGHTFDVRMSAMRLTNQVQIGSVLVMRDVTSQKKITEALKESESLYRLLAENSSDVIFLNAPDTRFIYASPSSVQISGYTPAELMAMDINQVQNLNHSEDVAMSRELYMRVLMGETIGSAELRFKRKDGSSFWGELRVKPIYDDSNQLTHVLSVLRNIDERRHIEEALIESNIRYDTLVNNIPVVVYQMRIMPDDSVKFEYFSPSAEQQMGIDPTAVIKDPYLLLRRVYPEDVNTLTNVFKTAAKDNKKAVWEGRDRVNGETRWVRIEAMPTYQRDGTILWNAVRSDITPQKVAELALEQQRKLLERITHLTPDTVHLFDRSIGNFIYVNRSIYQLLGYTTEELSGIFPTEAMEELLHPDDFAIEKTFGDRYATIRDDEIIETEYRWKHRQKGYVWLNVREMVYERTPEGEVKQFMGIVRDVTDRRRGEEERQDLLTQLQAANQELKDFAYVISHDLKAPLRGVNSVSSWLVTRHSDQLDEEGKHLVELLMGRVRRMEQMINGVLEYSRIGRMVEQRKPVDLNKIITEIIHDVVPAEGFNITVQNPLPTLTLDAIRIRQVFQNLIDNAVKFMDKTPGEISIRCMRHGQIWMFSVQDNGPGIPTEHYERIFQLFQTLVPKDRFESTGVGLTLARRIIEVYGGKIWLESQVGKGTTFFFTLPAQ